MVSTVHRLITMFWSKVSFLINVLLLWIVYFLEFLLFTCGGCYFLSMLIRFSLCLWYTLLPLKSILFSFLFRIWTFLASIVVYVVFTVTIARGLFFLFYFLFRSWHFPIILFSVLVVWFLHKLVKNPPMKSNSHFELYGVCVCYVLLVCIIFYLLPLPPELPIFPLYPSLN